MGIPRPSVRTVFGVTAALAIPTLLVGQLVATSFSASAAIAPSAHLTAAVDPTGADPGNGQAPTSSDNLAQLAQQAGIDPSVLSSNPPSTIPADTSTGFTDDVAPAPPTTVAANPTTTAPASTATTTPSLFPTVSGSGTNSTTTTQATTTTTAAPNLSTFGNASTSAAAPAVAPTASAAPTAAPADASALAFTGISLTPLAMLASALILEGIALSLLGDPRKLRPSYATTQRLRL